MYKAQKAFFNAFLTSLEVENIPVLVVGMPSLPANRTILPKDFWVEFRATMANMCAEHHAKWVDVTDNPNFVIADYLDTVHLNASGGTKVFAEIAKAVVTDPQLVAAIKAKGVNDQHLTEQAGQSAAAGDLADRPAQSKRM